MALAGLCRHGGAVLGTDHALPAGTVGVLRAAALRLDACRSGAARAGAEHSGAADEPPVRHADLARRVRHREGLRAGAVFLLGRVTTTWRAAGRGADRRLDPRLHRYVPVAAAEAAVRPLDALPVLRRGHAAGAGADGLLPGRKDPVEPGPGPRLARRQPEPLAGRRAAGQSPAHRLARLEYRGGGGSARPGSAGAADPHLARTVGRGDPHHLSARAVDQSAIRLQRAGGKPQRRHPPCQHLRRPRPLLDLPHPRGGRCRPGAVAGGGRTGGAGAGRCRPAGAARLPGAPARRHQRRAAAAGELAGGGTAPPANGRCPARSASSSC